MRAGGGRAEIGAAVGGVCVVAYEEIVLKPKAAQPVALRGYSDRRGTAVGIETGPGAREAQEHGCVIIRKA